MLVAKAKSCDKKIPFRISYGTVMHIATIELVGTFGKIAKSKFFKVSFYASIMMI